MSGSMHLAIIDDDEAVLDSLRLYFTRQNVDTSCFGAGRDFLDALSAGAKFDCVVSDVRMPGMSGLDLVQHLKASRVPAPVILITGHGDIDMAVAAIKVGAFDFIEKPFDEFRLLASIRSALADRGRPETDALEVEKLRARFDTLSARQRQVMELAVAGLSNKEIGSRLRISPKTVENHRAWVMERIGARNIADLVRMAVKIEGKAGR